MRTLLAGRELQIGVAALLLVSLADWPYGFYGFLRLAVCAATLILAGRASRNGRPWWAVAMGGVAILFNPIWPVHLVRLDWEPIDLLTSAAVAICPPVKLSSNPTDVPASQPTSITKPRAASARSDPLASFFRLLPAIFKARSRQSSAKLIQQADLARFLVRHALMETYQTWGESADKHASEIAGYLFNDPIEESTKKSLFWSATKIEAMLWLDAKPAWRELVLQTLKVDVITERRVGRDAPANINGLVESPVFQKYQNDYPKSVDPQSYKELIAAAFARSPDLVKAAARQYFDF